jgi:6-pyruvoyltetrahydropterin/6-carboxytetrahydropterin synthase
MLTICRRFEFAAAHHLPYYMGKCKQIHGHNYFLEVEVSGPIQTREFDKGNSQVGMILDFGDLKRIINDCVIERLDHQNLNTIWENPTAEIMVGDIAKWIAEAIDYGDVVRVRLWETSNSFAEWRKD